MTLVRRRVSNEKERVDHAVVRQRTARTQRLDGRIQSVHAPQQARKSEQGVDVGRLDADTLTNLTSALRGPHVRLGASIATHVGPPFTSVSGARI
jgi:hypothetical protein